MLTLKPEDFEPWVGKKVRVSTLPEPVELVLSHIERSAVMPGADFREPFILFFDGPPSVYLIDATYEFDCGRGGPYEINISQMPPTPKMRHYQAIFN
jgi:hypothetical protein